MLFLHYKIHKKNSLQLQDEFGSYFFVSEKLFKIGKILSIIAFQTEIETIVSRRIIIISKIFFKNNFNLFKIQENFYFKIINSSAENMKHFFREHFLETWNKLIVINI